MKLKKLPVHDMLQRAVITLVGLRTDAEKRVRELLPSLHFKQLTPGAGGLSATHNSEAHSQGREGDESHYSDRPSKADLAQELPKDGGVYHTTCNTK